MNEARYSSLTRSFPDRAKGALRRERGVRQGSV